MDTTRRRFIITTYGTVGLLGGWHIGCGADTPPVSTPAPAAPPPAPPPPDPLEQMRATMGALPIETTKLADNLVMLSGPGGNVAVLYGPDGKIVVDTFVQPAWDKLKQSLDGLSNGSITSVIDTHWHFDHSDNNQRFRQAGAEIVAHENTKKRMSQVHDLLGMHIPASPTEALPTQMFAANHKMTANGEALELTYVPPPAHTDTDIFIRYTKANVLHMGDVFFNGIYPFIDQSTGGSINGMIAGAELGLKLADRRTRIVPGHGPLGDRAALTKTRDMLVVVRDRVQKMKKSGSSLEDVAAAKPTKDLDEIWGKGFMPPDNFVTIVYNTL
ncbi:MAG TPA: MBL fold metallo-hydrolase [Vicinamibacterales bacterium]|nr:MBL fold metallo-hydrolase [Vicinamibacterales bacterium]